MNKQNGFDGFLSAALWIFGSGAVWSIIYFGITIAGNTYMFAFPIMLVTAIAASVLFVAAFWLMRGFPLSGAEEKKQAFGDGFEKREKLCRRMTFVSFGMLLPVAADLVILFLL
ncbi:MAG: hypothetical protein J5940_06265 [Clostridia bacterium]|nr:hypothetical protein [Clostridia bacterium]